MLQEDLESDRDIVTSIDLEIADPDAAPRDRRSKSAQRSAATISRCRDWPALNARFVGALQVERVMMFIILTLIVLVAAHERRGELHHAGAGQARQHRHPAHHGRGHGARSCAPSSWRRRRSGIVGTALGAALGLLICANMPAIGQLISSASGGTGRRRRGRFHRQPAGARAGRAKCADRAPSPLSCRSPRRPIRPGAPRGSNRSRHCAMSDRRQLRLSLRGIQRIVRAGRPPARGAARRLARPEGRRDRGPGRPVGQRQVDPAAHRRPARAAGRRRGDARRPATAVPMSRSASAPRCAAASSASSISITTCCRNSRRWRTSCCRRC